MNHDTAWDLIPWFVNGSASAQNSAELEQHLAQCADCRAEVTTQQAVMRAMSRGAVVESMPNASLQKLWSKIDAPAGESEMPASTRRSTVVRWLTAAVIVQALLLGVMSAMVKSRQQSAETPAFRTVSSPAVPVAAPGVRAVFASSLTLGDLHMLLAQAHLQIVAGPSSDGVYSLALQSSADDVNQALLAVRAHPAARFAERIGN
jgi:anti-sigma factor RsiW